jgi:hypothetical protein
MIKIDQEITYIKRIHKKSTLSNITILKYMEYKKMNHQLSSK